MLEDPFPVLAYSTPEELIKINPRCVSRERQTSRKNKLPILRYTSRTQLRGQECDHPYHPTFDGFYARASLPFDLHMFSVSRRFRPPSYAMHDRTSACCVEYGAKAYQTLTADSPPQAKDPGDSSSNSRRPTTTRTEHSGSIYDSTGDSGSSSTSAPKTYHPSRLSCSDTSSPITTLATAGSGTTNTTTGESPVPVSRAPSTPEPTSPPASPVAGTSGSFSEDEPKSRVCEDILPWTLREIQLSPPRRTRPPRDTLDTWDIRTRRLTSPRPKRSSATPPPGNRSTPADKENVATQTNISWVDEKTPGVTSVHQGAHHRLQPLKAATKTSTTSAPPPALPPIKGDITTTSNSSQQQPTLLITPAPLSSKIRRNSPLQHSSPRHEGVTTTV
ncbi:mucin-5AC-like [Ooceraea biroi]|uniref:mucin-5AC-like n=1 Tax=Ooceraea biroi TaxID=2015173 RepID=UPI000F089FCC|nr:mucin-5AC-like [Ooceraea biroi]